MTVLPSGEPGDAAVGSAGAGPVPLDATGVGTDHDDAPGTDPDRTPRTDPDVGLTADEVARRRAEGRTNDVPSPTSRTYGEILRANIVTPFNMVLGALLLAILAVGEYRDALFGIVLVLNALIGIVQESRSKRTLDALTLLNAPRARVRRDATVHEIADGDVVEGDVCLLAPGDQITVDGAVVEAGGFEVDESLLTGEADPVAKAVGDRVLSGSFVAAGSGTVVATAVGRDAYAYQLGEDARRFSLVRSELRDGINTIIKVATCVLVPTGALLAVSQLRRGDGIVEAVQGSVAGMVAMVPEGLILLTSTALAVSVIRLGRKKVLTQELAAIEGLARVDTICLDKTGTLTAGHLTLAEIVSLPAGGVEEATARRVLATMVEADPNPNPSLAAIGDGLDEATDWQAVASVPFSSARKWAAADLGGHGAWLLGAPDILLDAAGDDVAGPTRRAVDELAAAGRRVILLAAAPDGLVGEERPDRLVPAALTVLDESIRPEAADTIAYFGRQGVAVKVISGDSPVTVGAVAARVGVPGAEHPVDARTLPDDPDGLARALEERSVFGRVTPHQKRAMVRAMQARGHEVAMTGDGVNDTLALKDAEIGVAMGSGSPAARAVARFVLLDNSFAVFPSVVAEGRRVIANVERVANLFLTKTFYAMFLSLTVGVAGLPFPFLPRHLTLVSGLTIGIPGFFLALAPSTRRARPGFLDRVVRFALPAGLVAGVATLGGFYVGRLSHQSLAEDRTTALVVLFLVAYWVLALLARPFTVWRSSLVAAMGVLFVLAVTVPISQEYFEIDLPSAAVLVEALAVAVAACMLLEVGWHVAQWVDRRWGPSDDRSPGDDPDAPVLIPRTVPFNTSVLRQAWDRRRPGPPPADDGPD